MRLLLVEDNPGDALVIERSLRGSRGGGIELTRVGSVNEAERELGKRSPDLVILDLGLPDARDLDALVRVRRVAPDVPVVVVTGQSDDEISVQALHEGAEDFLVKGRVDPWQLRRSIRYAIERHRSRRELEQVTHELRRANQTLARLAVIDPLTELLNRRGLQEALSRVLESLQREGFPVMVLLVDLDDFKRINDQFGHAVGDIALKEVAQRLRRAVRRVDYVSRIGGDEFLLVLPKALPDEAAMIAERIRAAVSAIPLRASGRPVSLNASVASIMLGPSASIDELLARTHQLLARSKKLGKNRVSTEGDPDLEENDPRLRRRLRMCTALSRGEGLYAVRQPILQLDEQRVAGWEMLSRWRNGQVEMPVVFFRVCAERSILNLVDHQCLRRCIESARDLPRGLPRHVNLFPSTLLSLPVEEILRDFEGCPGIEDFCIEVSEQQIIGEASHLTGPVRALKAAGLKIAIDDVGFGNSSLESLILLEPDVIKIDRRCIAVAIEDAWSRTQLERLIAVSSRLAPRCIVEGIETEAQLALVRDLGVELGQGFLWGRPDSGPATLPEPAAGTESPARTG